MPRYKLTLEYDGTGLVGWQRQENGPSIQALVENALLRLAERPVRVVGAGRTDAGVHATGQVAHCDLDRALGADAVRDGLNYWLRDGGAVDSPVVVVAAEEVAADFHARFSATHRRYVYRIVNRRPPLVLERNRAWWVPRPLDAGAMHEAGQMLLGRHDFTSFRAVECQARSPVKTLDRLDVSRYGEEIAVTAGARSFLHHQVRNIVGSLKLVGEGRWRAADLKAALDARDRNRAGPTAPAAGLTLVAVSYQPTGDAVDEVAEQEIDEDEGGGGSRFDL
jgi:tRNA pseudouridine38-40 synthase